MRGDQRRCRPRFGSVWATEGFPPSRLLKVGVVVEGEVSASLPELVLVGEGFEAFAWLGIWDLLGVGPPVDGGADDFVHRGMSALRLVPGTIGTTAPAQAPHDFRIAAGDPGARLGTTRWHQYRLEQGLEATPTNAASASPARLSSGLSMTAKRSRASAECVR